MDLGIRGRKAIVCASSQGLGKGCARGAGGGGSGGRDQWTQSRAARAQPRRRFAAGDWRRSHPVVADVPPPKARSAPARGLSGARHPDQQQRRAAVSRLSRAGPASDAGRGHDEHGDADRTDSESHRRPWSAKHSAGSSISPRSASKCRSPGSICRAVPAPASPPSWLASPAASPDSNVTINNLLPGSFDTARLARRLRDGGEANRRRGGRPRGALTRRHSGQALRHTRIEFGQTCAFLCSVHAGYITGQNVLMDGGASPARSKRAPGAGVVLKALPPAGAW